DELALAMRELAYRPARDGAEVEIGQHLVDGGVGAVAAQRAARREPEILLHAEPVQHRGDLRLDADAEPHDVVGAPAGDVLAADHHPAARLRAAQLAGDRFEEGAFAGAVGSDETAQLALAQREGHVVYGEHAAEAHREVLRLDHRLAHVGASCVATRRRRVPRVWRRCACACARRRRHSVKAGTKPRGISSTTRMRMAPETSELSTSVW